MAENAPDPLVSQMSRQRRLWDAAKLVPLFAGILMLVPVLFLIGSATSAALVYVFSAWGFLIVLSAFLSRALKRSMKPSGAKIIRSKG
ncbi:hypothetical protein N9L47_10860 [Rhodobacteraceae bacterium]|nr:hypothetical protein [Paracoccaceae bacterium]